ncbi:MAG: ACT domain-containing protein [Ignavibacteriaceae bacterium]
MSKSNITILEGEFTIHRFAVSQKIPEEILNSSFFWAGKTDEELSVVCRSEIRVDSPVSDSNWSAIKVIGPMDLTIVGVLAGITGVLSAKKISIFALSTYDTDYILVKKQKLSEAIEALISEGYKAV